MGVKLFSSKLIIHLEKFSFFWQDKQTLPFYVLQFSSEESFENSLIVCDRAQSTEVDKRHFHYK